MDSRARLLAAAAEEFALHGPRGTRVRAVVERAGVNERMIYHHFGSKDGLYRAVLEENVGAFSRAWRERLAQLVDLPPLDAMRQAFRAWAELFAARPLLGPLLVHEGLGGWQVRPPLTGEQLPAALREIYRRGRADGTFRADVEFEVFYAVGLSSLVVAPTIRGLLDDRSHVVDQVIDLILEGLTGARDTKGE